MTDAMQFQPHQTLALAYAPGRLREVISSALQLENRLGAVIRRSSEPMIGQLKLAWWRDRFAQNPGEWPQGEPLLAAISLWPQPNRLGAMVDGYEALLANALDRDAVEAFANGRGVLWRVVAEFCGYEKMSGAAGRAGAIVGLADLAANLTDDREKRIVLSVAGVRMPTPGLPRDLRSLAVLAALAERSIETGGADPASGAGAYFTAVRVGLFGR